MKVPDPEFEGQTKTRLGNPEVRQIVDGILSDMLTTLFDWKPEVCRYAHCVTPVDLMTGFLQVLTAICGKASDAMAASAAARAARDMVSV